MQKKVTIGLDNYNGSACSFLFVGSVAVIEDDGSLQIQRSLNRLQVLFPGSRVEELQPSVPSTQSPVPSGKPNVSETPHETTVSKNEDEPAIPEEVVEEVKPKRRRK